MQNITEVDKNYLSSDGSVFFKGNVIRKSILILKNCVKLLSFNKGRDLKKSFTLKSFTLWKAQCCFPSC